MASNGPTDTAFREGEEVVLAKGLIPGHPWCVCRLKKDINWADIKERNGSIRSHPVSGSPFHRCDPGEQQQ